MELRIDMPVSAQPAADSRALQSLSDDDLLRRLGELVGQQRRVEADLVAHIGEVDERKLYAGLAFSSMFAYCTQDLHLSEAGAYRRITVARAARQHPILLAMLRDGRLHLTAAALLVAHLTSENRDRVLARATHASKREIEALVAELAPRPDAPARVRRLPERGPAPSPAAGNAGAPTPEPGPATPSDEAASLVPAPMSISPVIQRAGSPSPQLFPGRVGDRPAIEALSPGRHRVQFTASTPLREKLERLVALMHSEVPHGDLASIFDRIVTEKLARLEAKRFGLARRPRKTVEQTDTRPTSRRIPAAVRRAVHVRDEGRCRFVDEQGRRCHERNGLEFHHRYPFGVGGDHAVGNICLLCPPHNRHIAELDYGRALIQRRMRKGSSAPDSLSSPPQA